MPEYCSSCSGFGRHKIGCPVSYKDTGSENIYENFQKIHKEKPKREITSEDWDNLWGIEEPLRVEEDV
jgi:hypothetical protein